MVIFRSKIFFFGFVVLMIYSCTPKSNTYYNRQMQPIVTKYNVLFNGEEAFDLGIKEIEEQYQDDFSEILPVEPIRMSGEIQLDGMGNPNFDRAEEKAIKTIQLHSMVFNGVQRNYKIDDAYILLGKARYYNERFFPALEAFNHMLTNYGKSERINEAAIWAEKTNLRLAKNKIAIDNLINLLNTAKLKKNDRAEAYATLGQAYINQEAYNAAADALYKAGKYTKKKNLRGRYYFIAAQLYEKQKMRDSAVVAFDKVTQLNWKIPRRLWVEGQVGKARNTHFTPEEKTKFLEYLTILENRYEHKNYLDALYFQHAKMLEGDGKIPSAIGYYKKSLKNNTQNDKLKGKTHEELAELYFSKRDYVTAYHHFDSTLAYVPEHTFERLYLERKRENLAKITELEFVVKQSDSILKVIRLPKDEQIAFYQNHIDSINKIAETDKQKNKVAFLGDNTTALSHQTATPNGKFYFYNPISVAYGKQQFRQQWGGRKLEDNWRWASVNDYTYQNTDNAFALENDTLSQSGITPSFFVNQLPKTDEEKMALIKERNQALYQLGVLYKSKFNDSELAIERLIALLQSNPSKDLKAATLYELYKNYSDVDPGRAQVYLTQLHSEFPTSDYSQISQGNQSSIAMKNAEAEQLLYQLTSDFEIGKIRETASILETELLKYKETAIAPDLDVLKAKTIARLQGYEPYKQALEKVVLAYPETDASAKATALLEELQTLTDKTFLPDEKTTSWKIVIADGENNIDFQTALKEKLTEISNKLSMTVDLYNQNEDWLVIHGIKNKETATEVVKDLNEVLSDFQYHKEVHLIATENYRLVQMYKMKDDYITFEKKD